MLVDPSRIPAVNIFEAPTFPDERGVLLQSWIGSNLAARGIPHEFKQAIQTCSRRGVMRGLHFQWDPPMGKLVRCITGALCTTWIGAAWRFCGDKPVAITVTRSWSPRLSS